MCHAAPPRTRWNRFAPASLLLAAAVWFGPPSLTAGEGDRVGTCDWTVRMGGRLEAGGLSAACALKLCGQKQPT